MSNKPTITGAIELHGYEILHLVQPHSAILPTGETIELPTGTRLVMQGDGGGPSVKYLGSADSAPPRPPGATA